MTPEDLSQSLVASLSAIELPEAAIYGSVSNDMFALAQVQTSILSKFGEWLGEFGDKLPKEDIMELLEKAIDSAMVLLKEKYPVIVRLFGPTAKAAILRAASALFDSIVNPVPPVQV